MIWVILIRYLVGLATIGCFVLGDNDTDTLCHQFKSGEKKILVIGEVDNERFLILGFDYIGLIVPVNKFVHPEGDLQPAIDLSEAQHFHLIISPKYASSRSTAKGAFLQQHLATTWLSFITEEGQLIDTILEPPSDSVVFNLVDEVGVKPAQAQNYVFFSSVSRHPIIRLFAEEEKQCLNEVQLEVVDKTVHPPTIKIILNTTATTYWPSTTLPVEGGWTFSRLDYFYGFSNAQSGALFYKTASEVNLKMVHFEDFFQGCSSKPSTYQTTATTQIGGSFGGLGHLYGIIVCLLAVLIVLCIAVSCSVVKRKKVVTTKEKVIGQQQLKFNNKKVVVPAKRNMIKSRPPKSGRVTSTGKTLQSKHQGVSSLNLKMVNSPTSSPSTTMRSKSSMAKHSSPPPKTVNTSF